MTGMTVVRVAAMVAALVASSSATASAVESLIPLATNYKSCDYTQIDNVPSRINGGNGRALAYVNAKSGQVEARVELLAGLPDAHYDVRVIQVPRPSIGCGPGAPGVDVGSFVSDGVGAGSTTVRGPIAPGKTGAWVILERAGEGTQTPAEFYASEFIAKF